MLHRWRMVPWAAGSQPESDDEDDDLQDEQLAQQLQATAAAGLLSFSPAGASQPAEVAASETAAVLSEINEIVEVLEGGEEMEEEELVTDEVVELETGLSVTATAAVTAAVVPSDADAAEVVLEAEQLSAESLETTAVAPVEEPLAEDETEEAEEEEEMEADEEVAVPAEAPGSAEQPDPEPEGAPPLAAAATGMEVDAPRAEAGSHDDDMGVDWGGEEGEHAEPGGQTESASEKPPVEVIDIDSEDDEAPLVAPQQEGKAKTEASVQKLQAKAMPKRPGQDVAAGGKGKGPTDQKAPEFLPLSKIPAAASGKGKGKWQKGAKWPETPTNAQWGRPYEQGKGKWGSWKGHGSSPGANGSQQPNGAVESLVAKSKHVLEEHAKSFAMGKAKGHGKGVGPAGQMSKVPQPPAKPPAPKNSWLQKAIQPQPQGHATSGSPQQPVAPKPKATLPLANPPSGKFNFPKPPASPRPPAYPPGGVPPKPGFPKAAAYAKQAAAFPKPVRTLPRPPGGFSKAGANSIIKAPPTFRPQIFPHPPQAPPPPHLMQPGHVHVNAAGAVPDWQARSWKAGGFAQRLVVQQKKPREVSLAPAKAVAHAEQAVVSPYKAPVQIQRVPQRCAMVVADSRGRRFDMTRVVVNFLNVGTHYGVKVHKRTDANTPRTRIFDYEGVRRCVKFLKEEKNLNVIGVVLENYTGVTEDGEQELEVPQDIEELCESIERTPRIHNQRQHKSADDEMTIKLAFLKNCRFLDNDNYHDWLEKMQDEKVRQWLVDHQEYLQMRFCFFSTGEFTTLDGNMTVEELGRKHKKVVPVTELPQENPSGAVKRVAPPGNEAWQGAAKKRRVVNANGKKSGQW